MPPKAPDSTEARQMRDSITIVGIRVSRTSGITLMIIHNFEAHLRGA